MESNRRPKSVSKKKPEHIQNHIGKAKAAPHFPKFAEAMQYANVSVMGEIFYELKK